MKLIPKMLFSAALLLFTPVLFTACAQLAAVGGGASAAGTTLPSSPEAQIKFGADSLTAATTLATVALRNDKITVAEAKTFRAVLVTSSVALDDAHKHLTACRTATGSTAATSPDPCKATVVSIIQVALDGISSAKRQLDAKK